MHKKSYLTLKEFFACKIFRSENYEIDDIGTSAFISDLTSMYHETLNNRIYQT